MSTVNLLTATNVLLDLLLRAQQVGTLISTAQKEGRDVTREELLALAEADDSARANLEQAILTAKSEGR